MFFFQKLQVIQLLFIALAFGFSLNKFRDKESLEYKFITPYLAFNLIITLALVSIYKWGSYGISAILLSGFFSVIETYYLGNYIGHLVNQPFKLQYVILYLLIPTIFSLFFLNDPNLIGALCTNILITFVGVKYIKLLFQSQEQVNILHTSHFWITIGIFVCNASSLPTYIASIFLEFGKITPINRSLSNIMFVMYILLNIVMLLFIVKGTLCKYHTKQHLY